MNYSKITRVTVSPIIWMLMACAGTSGHDGGLNSNGTYAASPNNFRLSLTDAPNDDLTAVIVNVKFAELRLEGHGKKARLIVAENLGPIDLLQLQNGVTLPMADLDIPDDVKVTQIRLVLDSAGNYIERSDESRCDLHTPSAQKTGVKILIHDGVTVEEGYSYSVVVDFDAKKSIVQQGNGGCLLKPVLKLKSATRVDVDQPGEEEEVVTDDGSEQDGDGSGFDDGTDETIPEVDGDALFQHFEG